jgi:hypothetical protein
MKVQSEHESLWVFLRVVLAHDTLQEGRDRFMSVLQHYAAEVEIPGDKTALLGRVRKTLDWVEKHRIPVQARDDPEPT